MQKGQALVVVLLILGVVATIGLSVATRSVTEVRVSTTQDESSRALEAAEIGLERYLGGQSAPAPGTKVEVPDLGAGFYIPDAGPIGGDENFYTLPYKLVEGDIATIELPPCQDGACSMFRVCYGNDNPDRDLKIEVAFYYVLGDPANQGRVAVRRNGYDHSNGGVAPGFVSSANAMKLNVDCGTGTYYDYGAFINLGSDPEGVALNLGPFPGQNKLLLARIRMLGNGSTEEPIAVQIAGGTIPVQGVEVTAVGEAGESVQKLKASGWLWDLPPMFDSAVFSGTNLISP